MSDALRPRLVQPAAQEWRSDARRSLDAPAPPPAPVVHTIERVVEKAPAAAMPPSWRFVPIRDDSNLIVEIIATPFK